MLKRAKSTGKFLEKGEKMTTEVQELEKASTQPMRLPTDPYTFFYVDGFLEVLEDLEIEKSLIPDDLGARLRRQDACVDSALWTEINSRSIDTLAKMIYKIIKRNHLCHALYLASVITKPDVEPRETFRGREYKALPIEAAGKTCFWDEFEKLKPALPKLGLDKGVTRDCLGDTNYPEVVECWQRERELFYRRFLTNYSAMVRFIKNPRCWDPKWPDTLNGLFRADNDVLDAIASVATHYNS